jgi:diguanylate cyclase (GGDEF)-like protein
MMTTQPAAARLLRQIPALPAGLGTMSSGGWIVGALILVLFCGTIAKAVLWPSLALVDLASQTFAAGMDTATALVLLALVRYTSARPSIIFLALLYAAFALLATLTLLCIPLAPNAAALLQVGTQTPSYLLLSWKVSCALGAFGYIVLRRSRADGEHTVTRSLAIALLLLALATAAIAIAIINSARLPAIVIGDQFTPVFRFLESPALIAMCLAAAIGLFGIREPSEVDRAFAYTLLAVATQAALAAFGGERYSAPWYLSRLTFIGADALMLTGAIHTLVQSRQTLLATEVALNRSQHESIRHANRIRALWEIANGPEGGSDYVQAILDHGARTLRPGGRIGAYLSHLEDNVLVVDAISSTFGGHGIAPRATFLFEDSLESVLGAEGRSIAWNDFRGTFGDDADPGGWRSCIGAPISIGRKLYFIAFGSSEPTNDLPFVEDDIAYVDVLGAFLTHHFHDEQQRERIAYQIEHDALTGLKNGTQFRVALRKAIRDEDPFGLAIVDLDAFRSVNETVGHLIGDELLVEIASSLAGVDTRDVVARLPGDEFGIILNGLTSKSEARMRLGRYANVFEEAFHTGDRDGTRMLSVTASFGATYYQEDGRTAEALLRLTNVALNAAKSRGGACIVFYDESLSTSLAERTIKIAELSNAIDTGELTLAYQPTFSIDTCKVTGAEALVRWSHPERGELLPKDFVAFAEQNGLIGKLTRWVIDRVIADLSALRSIPAGFRCYINLATAQLDDLAFISELEQRLSFAPGIAEHLGVEITETAAIVNADSAMYALERFRKIGLRVAIDDFGTGYSSLSYLKRLPIDVIKIDRSFVSGLPDDVKDAALCELLLQIAARFDLIALAEGIETTAQLQWLREHGCDFGQGFLVGRPLAFAELAERLREPSREAFRKELSA